eukprot:comp21055_c0_seq1/m.28323 comp21055_c0_seq1/g.28323  ORF comp21055_c0_seq1/g.28323 comp21055_c0_seq1/m.28323 type:complete len:459 (-) comp21055_c0_seq1:438-1814(-)
MPATVRNSSLRQKSTRFAPKESAEAFYRRLPSGIYINLLLLFFITFLVYPHIRTDTSTYRSYAQRIWDRRKPNVEAPPSEFSLKTHQRRDLGTGNESKGPVRLFLEDVVDEEFLNNAMNEHEEENTVRSQRKEIVEETEDGYMKAELRVLDGGRSTHSLPAGFSDILPVGLIRENLRAISPNTQYNTLVMVVTHPADHRMRQTIRQTLARERTLLPKNGSIANVFVMGHSYKSTAVFNVSMVVEEAMLHGDIAVLDHVEAYHNLTVKTGKLLTWAADKMTEMNSQFDWLIKVDSDVYLNHQKLWIVLKQFNLHDNRGYMGRLFARHTPSRVGKWADRVYKGKFYPDYMNGPMYGLGSKLVSTIAQRWKEESLQILPNEDVSVGLWLLDMPFQVKVFDLAQHLFLNLAYQRVKLHCNLIPVAIHFGTSQPEDHVFFSSKEYCRNGKPSPKLGLKWTYFV